MGILDLLGLGKKKDATGRAQQQRPAPIPAAVQDSCCGSCGGQGHGAKTGTTPDAQGNARR